MMQKQIAAAALILFCTAAPMPVQAGTWQYQSADRSGPGMTAEGWQYFGDDGMAAPEGWLWDQGKWYYIGPDGFMRTGWIELNGSRYYLDESGAMVSGTSRDIDGVTYTFDENGALKEPSLDETVPEEEIPPCREPEGDGFWRDQTYVSSRLGYEVTVPEGFVPLDSFMDLYVDDTMTLDFAAAAPDMTVSMVVVTYDRMDDEFRGMDARRLAEVMGQGLGGYDEYMQIGSVTMVTLGNFEYAKLPVVYTGLLNQDLYFRWAKDSVMMVEIVYDPYRADMAREIVDSIR